jgi:hypothetical protein
MTIQTLIEKRDAFELVRDQIATILLVETASQQALALAADPPKDPKLWGLRVFTERSNPWDEFDDNETESQPLIVNVSVDNVPFDKKSSNAGSRQLGNGVFHIDVYGYGISKGTVAGHDSGDYLAALERDRGVRLVRNILMASSYVYLGLPRGSAQYVMGRWIQSIQFFQPQLDERPVENVQAARIALQVDFNETSPQYQAPTIELITATIKCEPNGQVLLEAHYPIPPAP